MKNSLKKIARAAYFSIAFILYYSGFLLIYLRIKYKNKFLIVFYHEIGNDLDFLGNIVTKPRFFEKQIKFLAKRFNPVTIDEINEFYNQNVITGHPVLITFDGGYKGNLHNAFPILKKYSTPGLIYLITNSIEKGEVPWTTKLSFIVKATESKNLDYEYDGVSIFKGNITEQNKTLKTIKRKIYQFNPNHRIQIINELSNKLDVNLEYLKCIFMNWNDIVTLNKSELIKIGSHTITHPRLNEISEEEVKKEIILSRQLIEERIGEKIISFCYPDGVKDEFTSHLVKEAGYLNATTTINGVNSLQTPPFLLRRIGGGNMPHFVLALKISGLFRRLNI